MHRSVITNEEALRRLTVNDERFVDVVLTARDEPPRVLALEPRTAELVRLGALIALGAGDAAIDSTVAAALAAGASHEDVVGVLVAVASSVGSARVVGMAPRIAAAIGYDVYGDLERVDLPVASGDRRFE